MFKATHFQRQVANARLLRQMIKAAADFNHARGKRRVSALKRYVSALHHFTDVALRDLGRGA